MERENIKLRKKQYEIKKNIVLSGDFLIPDTKPDIISTIGENGKLYINKKDNSNGKCRVEGIWNGKIIYLSDLGDIKVLEVNLDLLEDIECADMKIDDDIEFSYTVQKNEIKILNERKINILIEINLNGSGYRVSEFEVVSNLEDNVKLQTLERKITIKNFCKGNSNKANVNEEINMLEAGSNIEILNYDVSIKNFEAKTSYNKVLSKAEAELKILYLYENKINKFETKVPLMSFIEMEKVSDENIIDLQYEINKVNISNQVFEKGCINFLLEYEIKCFVYEKKEIKIIEDLYSLENDISFSKQNLQVEFYTNKTNEERNISQKIDIDCAQEIYDIEYEFKENKNILVRLYYKKDDSNKLVIKKFEFPFCPNCENDDAKFKILSCNVSSNNNEVICNFKIEENKKTKEECIGILEKYEICENKINENYSMVIYIVKPNDTIWEIAKKFKVSRESIIKLNNIDNSSNISSGEKIYIMKG